ncbi:MAG: OB-fold domain-containing protein [Actinomycetota bacterium]|nr:OB-fold domain-containing protein [Actinomycetota bacterium]
MPQRPIEDGLFTWPVPDPPNRAALIGARCADCRAVTFPASPGCPRCGADRMEAEDLPTRGTLYTWTTQEFLPKEPYAGPETAQTFQPWAVGYVELGDVLRVEGRLFDVDPAALDFGMELDVVVRPFTIREDGTEVFTFGFAPAAG